MNVFKQLHINIPIVEALSQISKYVKFLKDLLTNIRKVEEIDIVDLNVTCSIILYRRLPKKLRDLGSFVIQCMLGEAVEEHALADSRARINVMPCTIYLKLEVRELRPTRMTLHLGNRSVRRPRRFVEDILVIVEKLVFPIDFVIVDIDEDVETPLILDSPFQSTSVDLINWRDGKMTLKVGEKEVVYKLPSFMKHSIDHDDECYFAHEPDLFIFDVVQDVFMVNLLQKYYKEELTEESMQPLSLHPTHAKKKGKLRNVTTKKI
ncbi:uncharacterized protein LOC120282752 [Dioscorea cayenensis subsp. rotundata]|uniref:Uncharacterized protein LOC120282752 n=1 Tax=Dioscorea cayennensis subsp. rotundata TaxID=55577 RepID=A0AB40CZJ3_DIOCR|nr:uncharacterized protein LOC120282752 [Dioscorea cayenensis subsp. rotundata]